MSDYWIQTFTGKKFDLLEPTEDMICIEDIAHHLSCINRFCGAARFPYSVGYHSVLACCKAPAAYKLEALLHEVDEPYINDISYPMKEFIRWNVTQHCSFMDVLSNKIKFLADKVFKLNRIYECKKIIENIDVRLAITEEAQLMRNSGYLHGPKYEGLRGYADVNILKLSAENVEELFLKEYKKWKRV